MSEVKSVTTKKPVRKRTRPKQTYKHHTNAVHLTAYHPMGETIPAPVRRELEEAVMKIVLENSLLMGVATT